MQANIHYDFYLVRNKIPYDVYIGINAKLNNVYDVNIVRVFIFFGDWLAAGGAL